MSKKLYFYHTGDELCYPLSVIKQKMIEDKIKEKIVSLAVVDDSSFDYFFCNKDKLVGEKGTCSNECKSYEPRNKKSGCCRFYGKNLYAEGEEITIKL